MVRTLEELIESVKGRIGEDISDESISLIEDISDTYNDVVTRYSESEDWKKKYEDNDAEWRRRYIERFSGKVEESEDEKGIFEPEEKKTNRYEDLFEEVK